MTATRPVKLEAVESFLATYLVARALRLPHLLRATRAGCLSDEVAIPVLAPRLAELADELNAENQCPFTHAAVSAVLSAADWRGVAAHVCQLLPESEAHHDPERFNGLG